MTSVSKPRVRQNRHKQGLNQTLEKIFADFRVIIEVKENRVRVTSRIFKYIAGTWKGAEHTTPGDSYPVVPDAKQKDSHAMAFINCHYNGLLTVSSLIQYLNDNISTIKNDDDNW